MSNDGVSSAMSMVTAGADPIDADIVKRAVGAARGRRRDKSGGAGL